MNRSTFLQRLGIGALAGLVPWRLRADETGPGALAECTRAVEGRSAALDSPKDFPAAIRMSQQAASFRSDIEFSSNEGNVVSWGWGVVEDAGGVVLVNAGHARVGGPSYVYLPPTPHNHETDLRFTGRPDDVDGILLASVWPGPTAAIVFPAVGLLKGTRHVCAPRVMRLSSIGSGAGTMTGGTLTGPVPHFSRADFMAGLE